MPVSAQIVHQRLDEASRKLRWSRSARYFLGGTALALFFLVLFLTLDAWLHFGRTGRWAGLAFVVTALVAGFVLGARTWQHRLSEAATARRLEEASAGSGNVLISAVQFDRQLATDSPLRAALYSEMADPFPKVQWNRVFDVEILKKLGLALGAVVVVFFGWAVAKPGYFANSMARIALPSANIAPLTRTKIENIIPGDDTVVHGRDVSMQASLNGEVPKTAWVWFREAGSSWQKALMDREAGQPTVNFKWKEVRQPLEYYLEAGDAVSATHRLNVRPRTAIKARTAEIAPPAYTGLGKQVVNDFSVLQNITPGSAVTLGIEFNNDLAEVQALDDKGASIHVEKQSPTRWEIAEKVTANQAIKLTFQDALGASDTATLQVAVKADEPPKINILEPAEGKELSATKGSALAVKFSTTDNFALGAVAVYQSTNDKEDAKLIQNFPEAGGKQLFEATVKIPLRPIADEDRVTFRIVARDRNDVSGPGVTMSRPIVVSLQSPDQLAKQVDEAAAKLQKGIEALIKLQSQNLDESKVAAAGREQGALTILVDRQVQIADAGRGLAASAEVISADVRNELRSLTQREMQAAIIALRNAGTLAAESRAKFLGQAIALEKVILAKLQGAPAAAGEDNKKNQIADLVSGVEELLKRQRELHKEAKGTAPEKAPALSPAQDALAEKAVKARTNVDKDSKNASIGDEEFRKRLAKVAAMFGEMKIYEDMLAAAEQLQTKKVEPAIGTQQRVVANLAKMVELMNQWQLADANKQAEDLKKEAEQMQQKLDKLAQLQQEIVEKTKEMARKNEFRAEDMATADEIKESKDLMKDVVEHMVTDMQAFPDMKPGNEMKGELVQILEDVDQTDLQDIAGKKLKPQEIAVQKEQGLLDAIEQAKKIAADMEMWLPNKSETQKWLMENFDKSEMPEIPNLPLADAFEDIVGNLQKKQEDIQEEVQDAASNQAFAMNPANGWEIADGPMPGFGAQGKSGNQAPNHNEQMGRSSGGREGMSDGEMAGDKANSLEGDTPEARRTKDPLQQGQVQDDGGGHTRATGGGKAGGFSDRNGMEGDAPVRATQAPQRLAANAAAVKQALLAEKTAKTVAQASLLYLHSDGLKEVAQMMDDNATALKEGRMRDAQSLHQRIVGRLKEIRSGAAGSDVVAFNTNDGARAGDKQLLGGNEGEAPPVYKDMVADYFRSLAEEK